jgi:hypothetical protein
MAKFSRFIARLLMVPSRTGSLPTIQALTKSLGKLTDCELEAIRRFYFEGQTAEQIQREIGLSIRQLEAVRKKLRPKPKNLNS